MQILQLSDSHVRGGGALCFGRVDTLHGLRRAVDDVLRWPRRPDVVLVTGDLTEDGSAEAAGLVARELGRLDRPVHVVPGNHDSRQGLRAAFPALPADGFLQFAVDLGELHLVALDTFDGPAAGRLCADRLAWTERTLAGLRGKPTLVMLHHPPLRLGLPFMDRYPCVGGEALAPLLARHGAVQAVLCGHVHRTIFTRFAGVALVTGPSPSHQFPLDALGGTSFGWVMEPPGCLLHEWRADSGLVSHFVPLGDFGPVRPFKEKRSRLSTERDGAGADRPVATTGPSPAGPG